MHVALVKRGSEKPTSPAASFGVIFFTYAFSFWLTKLDYK